MLTSAQIRQINTTRANALQRAGNAFKSAQELMANGSSNLTETNIKLTSQEQVVTPEMTDARLSEKLSSLIDRSLISAVLAGLNDEQKATLLTWFDVDVKPRLVALRSQSMSVNQFQLLLMGLAKQLLNKTSVTIQTPQQPAAANAVSVAELSSSSSSSALTKPSTVSRVSRDIFDDESVSDESERPGFPSILSPSTSPSKSQRHYDNVPDLRQFWDRTTLLPSIDSNDVTHAAAIKAMIDALVEDNRASGLLTLSYDSAGIKKERLLDILLSLFNQDMCNPNIKDAIGSPFKGDFVRSDPTNMHSITNKTMAELKESCRVMIENMTTYAPVLRIRSQSVYESLKALCSKRGVSVRVPVSNDGETQESSSATAAAAESGVVSGSGLRGLRSNKMAVFNNNKYMIDVKKLIEFQILDLRYVSNRHLVFPSKPVSKLLAYIILNKVKNDKLDAEMVKRLGPHEMYLFKQLMSYLDIDYDELDDASAYASRFELLRGEMLAGNDSKAIRQEMMDYLRTALHTKRISKRDYDLLLGELGI